MRVVAVSQRVDVWSDRGETRDALDQRLVDFLAAAGCHAIPVPNRPQGLSAWLQALPVAGVVLSGGNDIGRCPERDDTERGLLEWARAGGHPVLGICRGMQMLCVHAGGELAPMPGHVRTRHELELRLREGVQHVQVNSYHDWVVPQVPPGYEAGALAADGSVEAMWHTSLPWQGWMWHPEREATFDALDVERARRLFG